MNIPIDFVIPVLDPTETKWQAAYSLYSPSGKECNPARYRDWGWLRYWLRGVEQNAPWVHRVFILSSNTKPQWLTDEDDRIKWVDHSEFIPKEMLPVFCANSIELNLHRIPGLSEHFVYFNDDTLLNAPVSPDYYFRDGLPVDATAEALFFMPHCEDGTWGTQIMEYCGIGLLKRHFKRSEVVRGNWQRWYGSYLPLSHRIKAFLISFQNEFINFNTPHLERPLLKSIFEEVWNAEPEFLRKSCSRFREAFSANVYLMRYWQLASNRFWPDRVRLSGHYYTILPETIDRICKEITDGQTASICLNDVPDCTEEFYQIARTRILSAFQQKYPFPCSFERAVETL